MNSNLRDGNWRLVLQDACSQGGSHRADLHLDISVRNRNPLDEGWGFAYDYALGQAKVNILEFSRNKHEETSIKIWVKFPGDNWVAAAEGHYQILLKQNPNGTPEGNYTGKFRQTSPAKIPRIQRPPIDAWLQTPEPKMLDEFIIKGNVSVRIDPVWPACIREYHPLEKGEHPRLVFRKKDVPKIRNFVQNDTEGREMLQAIELQSKETTETNDKFSSMPAVALGTLFQLTGNKAYAKKAAAILRKTLLENPAGAAGKGVWQDIHHAPRLLALSLSYDLCYEVWETDFCDQVAGEIAQRVRECGNGQFNGEMMRGFDPFPWSNHNAIRMGAVAVGAVALLDNLDNQGEEYLPEAGQWILQSGRELRLWLETAVGQSGCCAEGSFYKYMTMVRGWAQGVWALRTALGQDWTVEYHEGQVVGQLLEAPPGMSFLPGRDYDGHNGNQVEGGHLGDILFTLLWPLIPPEWLGAVKHIAERKIGKQGNHSYGISQPVLAPYAVAGWPKKVKETNPALVFPWMISDPRQGHSVFRPNFQDGNDILFTTNFRSDVRRGYHWERLGVQGELRLWGFGELWLDGPSLPHLHFPLGGNDIHGPKLEFHQEVGRKAWLGRYDLWPAYLTQIEEVQRHPEVYPAGKNVRLPFYLGDFLDLGITGKRDLLVDASGTCGAPLLLSISDQLQYPGKPPAVLDWTLPLPSNHGFRITIDGNRFVVSKGQVSLSGIILTNGETKIENQQVKVRWKASIWLIATLQNGPPPELEITGNGLETVVKVNSRCLRKGENGLSVE